MDFEENSLCRRHLSAMNSISAEIVDKEKSVKVNYATIDSFHKAISPVLLLAQCLALMPVVGIRDPNPYHLKFRVKSKAMILAFGFMFFGSMLATSHVRKIFKIGPTAKNFVGIVFLACGISVCILFLFLARNWPQLMRHWFDTEIIFLQSPYEPLKRSLSSKVRLAAVIIISSALVEHILYLASDIYSKSIHWKVCNISQSFTVDDYLYEQFSSIFDFIPYSLPVGLVCLFLNFLFTFMWNYMDLFIVMISLGLSVRFKQINNRIAEFSGKDVPEAVWMEVRHNFVLLCELLESVDAMLSGIILLSSMNNLYFICYQLLNILNKLRYTINYVYFWFSLIYLISRTTGVFLYAASINDEAAKPLKTLRHVPSRNWCSEIERFNDQITMQCVALSGMKFFYLTRKLFFGMVGTIVTYELVLLQLDDPSPSLGPLCD